MQDCRLKVTNIPTFLEAIRMSHEMDCIDSLLIRIERLGQWESVKPIIVDIWAKAVDELEFVVFTGDKQVIAGAIIYHKISNLWGTHT